MIKFGLTQAQQAFLATGTHVAISIAEHSKMLRRALRFDRDWPEDSILNWDGTLLPMSSALYIGRIYVRLAGWKPARQKAESMVKGDL